MSDPDFLVCARVADTSGSAIPGSATATCASCGADVWVAPSGQRRMDGMVVICVGCATDQIRQAGGGDVMPLQPDQAAELAAHLRRQASQS